MRNDQPTSNITKPYNIPESWKIWKLDMWDNSSSDFGYVWMLFHDQCTVMRQVHCKHLQTYALTAQPSGRGWKICGYLTLVTLIRKQLVLSQDWIDFILVSQENVSWMGSSVTRKMFSQLADVALYCAGCWQNILANHPTEESSGLTILTMARWLRNLPNAEGLLLTEIPLQTRCTFKRLHAACFEV
jgi:hypothetical protein